MHANAQHKTRLIAFVYLLALGCVVAILLGPQILPACGGRLTLESTNHHCNKTFAVVTGIAFIALAATIGSWFTGNSRSQIAVAGLLAGLAASVLALPRPWALGICRRDDMACHQTELATAIPAAVLLLVAIGLLISASRKGNGQVSPLDPWDERESEPSNAAAPVTRRRKCCG